MWKESLKIPGALLLALALVALGTLGPNVGCRDSSVQTAESEDSSQEKVRKSVFLTRDEFFKAHPEQEKLVRAFAAGVAQSEPPKVPPGKKVSVAVVYPGGQASDYWRRQEVALKARLQAAGVEHELVNYKSDYSSMDVRAQERQLKTVLEAGHDYLVFNMDALADKRLLERVLARAKPKVIVQNLTTPLRSLEGGHPFLYTGFDHLEGTKLLADHLQDRPELKGKKYAMLYYKDGPVNDLRAKSFLELARTRGMTLGGEYYTEGQRDKAKKAAADALKDPDVRALYAVSTDIALGAAEAVKEAGRTKEVVVNGWGGGSAELDALVAGDLDVTVMRMNDDAAVAAADAIALDLLGRTQEVPTLFSGRFEVLTQPMNPARLEQLKTRAFRYSRKKTTAPAPGKTSP